MTEKTQLPQWVPQVEAGGKILVVGASGGIGSAVVEMLLKGPACTIGVHRSSSDCQGRSSDTHTLVDLQATLNSEAECVKLVDEFTVRAGGISGLVVSCGGISRYAHWMDLEESEWTDDINLNLNIPFYLARAAMQKMDERCGRIVFIGTESAIHGGSPTGLPYAVAKRGLECLVQGLAREGAGSEIMVNGVRAGLIRTGAHERWQGKTEEDMKKRAEMVPVKRAGEPEEAAALIVYLLSGWAGFITGQMLPLTGGDWL